MESGGTETGQRLGGWKAIARYVGRDVRTVQRWERDRQLPVHRIPGGDLSAVFAWPPEVDGWLSGAPAPADGEVETRPNLQASAPGLLVLPFHYYAQDPSMSFVGDALADELIGRLAATDLASTRVLSWTTSSSYRQSQARAPQIADDLAVRYLVEGSVKDAGARWRVDIRVIDAVRDAVLFTHRFACAGREVLLLQSQIAEAVSAHLSLHLAGDPIESEWTREVDPAALLSHFHGISQWRCGTRSSIARALELFAEAQRIDPSYVPAKATAASVLIRHRNWYGHHNDTAHHQARTWAEQCVSEAPRLLSTALLDAQLAAYDYDWSRAERQLGGAIAASPACVEARTRLSNAYSLQRKFAEADAVFEPVLTLDNSAYICGMDATRLMWKRDHVGAVAKFAEALQREPDAVYPSLMRYATALHVRDGALARRFCSEIAPEVREPLRHFIDGTLAAVTGNPAQASVHRDAMTTLLTQNEGISYLVAMIDALNGNSDGAIEHLTDSVNKQEPQAPCASVDPTFDCLHQDIRFNKLMRTMNLPTYSGHG
ncbi:MAG: hypothetical protein M3Z31_17215 [Pseudomonadota bacterium]|nr:hypothetical protein [Pseudomonadota bacterium]